MELQGTIINVGQREEYGANGFFKRQLLIKTHLEKYPQILPIDFLKENSDLLNDLAIGDEVKVNINLRGSKSQSGKHYVNIVGWKIDKF
jgi:hypothetical protein